MIAAPTGSLDVADGGDGPVGQADPLLISTCQISWTPVARGGDEGLGGRGFRFLTHSGHRSRKKTARRLRLGR